MNITEKAASPILTDGNNNDANTRCSKQVPATEINSIGFVERLLLIRNNQYLIIPNGGSGDCMFKAVCQAVYRGDELRHTEVRKNIVDFIVKERWGKLKESIEVQHVSGNQELAKKWKSNPPRAYLAYMSTSGTLGSSSELNAAGELFQYNFATIQEYTKPSGKFYRVENCCHYRDARVPFYCFFFTGDFDNGHWEFLEPVGNPANNQQIPDGIYEGLVMTRIEGAQNTVDNWLKVNTQNTNDAISLKLPSIRTPSKQCSYPLEWNQFQYDQAGYVQLHGEQYKVFNASHTDLFSVLAWVMYDNPKEEDVDRFEERVLNYRLLNFTNLNLKIVTQPHSHGFNVVNLKYLSMPSRGNIQDLLTAADLFSFSFQVFIKPLADKEVQVCKFIHVDRWGEETETLESFFMRVFQPSSNLKQDETFAKWWYLERKDGSQENQGVQQPSEDMSHIGDWCAKEEKQIRVAHSEPIENITIATANLVINPRMDPTINNVNQSCQLTNEDLQTLQSDVENHNDLKIKTDQDVKRTSFSKIHDNFWSGKNTIPMSSNIIDALPLAQITADPFVLREANGTNVPNIKDLRRIKTIVEMFDEKTKRRKKYVYHGFVSTGKVLNNLYLQGLINDPVSDPPQVKKGSLDPEEPAFRHLKIKKFVSKVYSSIIHKPADPNRKQSESDYIPSEPLPLEIVKRDSVSNIALVAEESILRTTNFMKMHRRVAPSLVNNKNTRNSETVDRKDCLRRFLSWATFPFRSFKQYTSR